MREHLRHFIGGQWVESQGGRRHAVINPATGGIVCRSTLTDPTNGCMPLNLFGVGSASQQAINYITGTSVRDWRQSQQVVDLVVRGEPFSTWAGPVSVAFGGQYRNLNVDVTSDPISATPNVSLDAPRMTW